MARSLNKVILIGNLTRDPELRYTPAGTAVCTFSVATNRQWKTEGGDMRDEAEYHRAVAWDKLGEICSQMLGKGKRVYIEGRLQTRKWTGQDGVERQTVEVVVSDMILLDTRRSDDTMPAASEVEKKPSKNSKKAEEPEPQAVEEAEITEDDIPF